MKKSKLLAPFLMLFAGAVASITMFRLHYDTKDALSILLLVLVVFYIIGLLVQYMVGRFVRQNEEAAAAVAEAKRQEEAAAEAELYAEGGEEDFSL